MSYIIVKERCQACSNCDLACPVEAIGFNQPDHHYYIKEEKCIDCGRCSQECPMRACIPPKLDRNGNPFRKINRIDIIKTNCIGCGLCAKACPINAISGDIKKPYTIDASICVLCGICADKCKKDAMYVETGGPLELNITEE